jgi:hypothetical protein
LHDRRTASSIKGPHSGGNTLERSGRVAHRRNGAPAGRRATCRHPPPNAVSLRPSLPTRSGPSPIPSKEPPLLVRRSLLTGSSARLTLWASSILLSVRGALSTFAKPTSRGWPWPARGPAGRARHEPVRSGGGRPPGQGFKTQRPRLAMPSP